MGHSQSPQTPVLRRKKWIRRVRVEETRSSVSISVCTGFRAEAGLPGPWLCGRKAGFPIMHCSVFFQPASPQGRPKGRDETSSCCGQSVLLCTAGRKWQE